MFLVAPRNRNGRRQRGRGTEAGVMQLNDTPSKKRRRLALKELSDSKIEQALSNDMMHHVFGFFLCDCENRVDGATMKSVMLVSKRWNVVATSRSLWATLDGPSKGDPISNALAIEELENNESEDAEEAQNRSKISLIGFAKQSSGENEDGTVVYRATERSSGRKCRIYVSPKHRVSTSFLNHIFEAHFFQGEKDYLDPCGESVFMKKDYPRGVAFRDEQVIRWYEDDDIYVKLPAPIFGLQPHENMNGEQMLAVKSRLPSGVDSPQIHMRRMERAQSPQLPIPEYFCRRSWALVVDWLVEIAHCFTLPYRTTFHAMDLFGRFLATVEGQIHKSFYQLAASACMQIASKCNRATMKPSDFVYCSDHLFSLSALGTTEAVVLEILDFRLAQPTIMDFIEAFEASSTDIGLNKLEWLLLRYLAQLALQSQIHRYYEASFIAACIVVLARFCSPEKLPLWKDGYEEVIGYKFDKVCDGVVTLSTCLEDIRVLVPNVDVIERKFLRLAEGDHDGVVPSITSSSMLHAYQRRVTSNDSAASIT